jgi:zinc protease
MRTFFFAIPIALGILALYNKKNIPEITLGDINQLTQERMTTNNRVVTIAAPKKNGIEIPSDTAVFALIDTISSEQIAQDVDTVSNRPLLSEIPTPGAIISEKNIDSVGVTEWSLSNGARVVLKPTNFKNDEILFSAQSAGGSSLSSDAGSLSAGSASDLVTCGGVGAFDEITLQKMLAGKIVSVYPYIGLLDEGFSGRTSPKDIGTLLQLAYMYFTSPREDTVAVNAYLSRWRSYIQNQNADPETAFFDTVQVTMAQYNTRALPLTESRLNNINLDTAFQFYKNRFADASDFTFFFVGNFNPDTLKPLVQTYLASLPALHRHESWRDVGIYPPKGKVKKTVFRGVEPKSLVRLIFTGPFDWTRQNRFDLRAMLEVLRFKLREQLREEKGGVYGVSVSGSPKRDPRPEYTITISFGCSPERVGEFIKTTMQQIDSLENIAPSEEYIAKVRETERRELEVNLKENGYWLSRLKSAYYYGENPVRIVSTGKFIDAITARDVQNAAAKYFETKNVATFVLYPQKK